MTVLSPLRVRGMNISSNWRKDGGWVNCEYTRECRLSKTLAEKKKQSKKKSEFTDHLRTKGCFRRAEKIIFFLLVIVSLYIFLSFGKIAFFLRIIRVDENQNANSFFRKLKWQKNRNKSILRILKVSLPPEFSTKKKCTSWKNKPFDSFENLASWNTWKIQKQSSDPNLHSQNSRNGKLFYESEFKVNYQFEFTLWDKIEISLG